MKGSEVKALRTRLDLTQKSLAEIVGVNSNTVARWERGEMGISPGMTDRLLAMAQSLPSGAAISRTSGVTLDPHHRAILDGLNGSLDPEAFEKCAVDLLQADWPGLISIRGGRDDGFDGAVADGSSQEPFPLIVTTGANLVRNFAGSLGSAQRAGWKPRRALFATSQRITPHIRRQLRDASREKGVALVQIYDQDWFAGRLYNEPQWCKRLLDITGRPHALSVFPITRRPVLGDDVLGREQEMEWLLEPRGDCLVVGEPGSGKTFLLRALALQGKALFLVDEDREQIANDLRSLKAEAVIVDDAHVQPASIANLAQLRHEVRADFRIIATCWPGEDAKVRSELQIGSPSTLVLDRIDADTMIEIIKSVGIYGPDQLLYAIRSQAAGRPGLAATLAHLCIVSGVGTVTSGEGLVDSIAPALDQVLGFDSTRVLAPFALGGNSGARKEDVAGHLGMSLLGISSALATLGAAGIVRVRSNSSISVEPLPMRWVLVRRVFFDGPGCLPLEPFLSIVGSRRDCLETLIGARSRGADVPDLEPLLEEVNSADLWAKYASEGPENTRYALGRHAEMIGDLAEPALMHLPEKAIPMLLSRMANEGQASEVSELPLRPLTQWIRAGNSCGWDEALNRRQTLLRCAEAWWRRSRNSPVSIAAMRIALDSDFDFETPDPGSGTRITFTKAALGATVINPLATSWPRLMTVVNGACATPWTVLLELVQGWCHPRLSDDETRTAARQFLSLMLRDLALASRQCPGVQHRIADIAKRANMTVCTKLDREFECLYPPSPHGMEDINRELERLAEDARELARRWRNRDADDVAGVLGRIETEARLASINYPRLTPEFCRTLAEECLEPEAKLRVFMRKRLPADVVEPFLRKAVEKKTGAWSIVSNCLNDELYIGLGVVIAVCNEHAPPEVISSALAKVGNTPRLVENLCIRQEVSQVALSEMLQSPETSTAISAAIGHWQAFRHSPEGIQMDETWQCAFLRSAETRLHEIDCYWVGEILARDGELSVKWLIRFLDSDESSFGYFAQETAKKAIGSLDAAQRINILTAIRPRQKFFFGAPEIVHALVGSSAEVYDHLLRSEDLKHYHLSPLMGKPGPDWRSIAILALDHGYSCDDVVDANLGGGWTYDGDESEMWAALRLRYEQFEDDDDFRMVEIGQIGAQAVAKLETRAKEREREEAVYGILDLA